MTAMRTSKARDFIQIYPQRAHIVLKPGKEHSFFRKLHFALCVPGKGSLYCMRNYQTQSPVLLHRALTPYKTI